MNNRNAYTRALLPILALLLASSLTACTVDIKSTDVTPEETTALTETSTAETTLPQTTAEEPLIIEPTHYASYDELASELLESTSHETLFIPTIDGKPAVLRDEEGYPSVTHFDAELYDRPWIWYHCKVDGISLIVKTMYLSDTEQSYADASTLIRDIAPNAPNVDNYADFANYERIHLVEVELADRSASVMVSEVKDDSRHFYAFVYENMLVGLQSNTDILETDIFKRLAFYLIERQ